MNAWTGPDYTAYPFSTQNEKDFRNLMNVYLDAAYFPNLDRFDFMQEVQSTSFQELFNVEFIYLLFMWPTWFAIISFGASIQKTTI